MATHDSAPWIAVSLTAAVVIALFGLAIDDGAPEPDTSARFKSTTDVQAAHYCLDHHYKYFVRDRADSAFCRNDAFGESGDGTDAQGYLRGTMVLP